jgi:hypothetical protein
MPAIAALDFPLFFASAPYLLSSPSTSPLPKQSQSRARKLRKTDCKKKERLFLTATRTLHCFRAPSHLLCLPLRHSYGHN